MDPALLSTLYPMMCYFGGDNGFGRELEKNIAERGRVLSAWGSRIRKNLNGRVSSSYALNRDFPEVWVYSSLL